jgi:molybdenum cofactor sulfurtransferase
MAVSFYKMFGYPTGVGALVVKKSFLAKLQRPWFAGGTGADHS